MTVRRWKGRAWMVDIIYTFPDGKKKRIRKIAPGKTKTQAEEYEKWLLRELLSPVQPRKEVPTLKEFSEEFIEDYAKNENKPSEVMSKEAILRLYLKPSLASKRLDEIGTRDIARLKSTLRGRGLSDKSIKNALAVLSKLLRYAEECEIIDRVPKIKMPKVPEPAYDFLTFEEAERLLDAAFARPDWHAMIFTALKTGLRYGELCELRWDDVDLVAGRLVVRRSYTKGHVTTPKNGKTREVPLSPATVQVLNRLRGLRHLQGGLVFCKPDGGRRIHRRADVTIKRLCRQAGMRPISWHVLRHTFASHLIMRGRSLKETQELLGHSDIKQTMRYAHLSPNVKREAVAVLDSAKDLEQASEDPKSWQLCGNGSVIELNRNDRSEVPSPKTPKSRTLTSAAFGEK